MPSPAEPTADTTDHPWADPAANDAEPATTFTGSPSTSPAELVARCRFPAPGTAVDCGVSGGADSLALLVLAVEAGCRVTAVHVDHGLRPGSAAEADVVAAAATRFGARFRAEQAQVSPGPNLEARAREARYRVLGPDTLVAHTADDQAETVLLNLLRGAAAPGLGGMSEHRRPLLGLRRAETEALCRHVGLDPIADPMNNDPRFTRVRVRHEVLPLLDEVAGRDLVPVLCRNAAHLRDLVAWAAAAADDVDPRDARAVAAAPRPVAATAIRAWLAAETGADHPVDTAAVERVLAVAEGRHLATEIPGGHRVARSDQRLRVERAVNGSER